MADELIKPDELLSQIGHRPSGAGWMDTPVDIRKGMYCYASNPKSVETLGLPNARAWNPLEDDWKLPENWKEIVFEGFRERLEKFRSFKVFMDICVRCGACADKCHFFIGTGDPKNMPVLRAELLRSVYRNDFTTAGKILGRLGGARPMTLDVLKEWWYYLFQCTECRRCSVFCPYGIDTAEITIMGREILNLLGLNIDWIATPVANCYRTGNHLGIQPHAFKDMLDFFVEDIEEITGIQVDPPYMEKGADILFITPSGDVFADPGTYTCMGYMLLFHYLKEKYGLRVTWSTYASEGGNFGFFHLPRNDEAAEFKDVRRGQAPGRQMDSGRRVRAHVAGDLPVHGYNERPCRFPGSAGQPHHRHRVRKRQLYKNGSHRRVYRRPDQTRQAGAGPQPQ
jgi:ferredoxin